MDAGALTVLAILALLVRAGHAAHTIGSVRARSVADSAIRGTLGSATVVLAMWCVGRALAWLGASDDTGRVEGAGVFFTSPSALLGIFAVALVPSAVVEGATAERMRVLGGTIVGAAVVVLAWSPGVALGWAILRRLDASDAAISAIWPLASSHVTGGVAGIVAARSLGARAAKFNRDGSTNVIPPHNLAWAIVGDAMLIVGSPLLAGVVAGEPAARIADALLAAAAAALAAAIVSVRRTRRVDAIGLAAAAVFGSLVGGLSTPDGQGLAITLGALAGGALPIAASKLELKLRVDDPSGLALVHLFGGVLGAIGAGFATTRPFAEPVRAIAAAIGLLALAATWTSLVTWLAMRLAGRVSADAEAEGVDLALHDVNAYPDFQQTLIKSYHLRE